MLTILIILLILGFFGGGTFVNGGAYGGYGYSLGGILLIVLLVLLFTHTLAL